MTKHNQKHVKTLSCKKCDYKTTDEEEFKEHKIKEHKPTIYECDSCDFQSVHSNQQQKHKRTEHLQPSFSCDICSYKPTTESDLRRHKQSMHGGTFACIKCDITCRCEDDLIFHMSFKHGSYICNKSFNSKVRNKCATPTPQNKSPETKTEEPEVRRTANPEKMIPEDEATKTSENPNVTTEHEHFECKQTCSARQKSFSSKDELDLHTEYFHGDKQ